MVMLRPAGAPPRPVDPAMPPTGKRGPLLSGQRYIWLRHQQLPPGVPAESNVLRRLDLAPGTSPQTIRATVNYLVRRHEGLRTTYHHDVDGDPYQVVHPPSPVDLPLVPVEPGPGPGAAAVVARLTDTPFRLAEEGALRGCVLTRGAAPTQLVLVFNHMTVDAWSLELLEAELQALSGGAAGVRPTALRPVRHQPLDLARTEISAHEYGRRCRAHWAGVVAGLPDDLFAARRGTGPGPTGPPPVLAATLTSPALLAASRRLADRYQVWPALIHLAAHARALGTLTGAERVAHLYFSGNRTASSCPDVVACSFSPLPVLADLADDPPFAELVHRLAAQVERAEAHAGLPYDELLDLLAGEGAERGRPVRLTSALNVLGHPGPSRARRTILTRGPASAAWAAQGDDTLLRVHRYNDAVAVALQARADLVDPAQAEALLRGYEALLLAAVEPNRALRAAECADLFGYPDRAGPPLSTGPDGPAGTAGAVPALLHAVSRAHALPRIDPTADYVGAGGRSLRIPRVLALLDAAGWSGLTLADLLDGRALGDVAAGLHRTR